MEFENVYSTPQLPYSPIELAKMLEVTQGGFNRQGKF